MAILMVSPFSYSHFGNKILGGHKSFGFLIILVGLIIIILKFNTLTIAFIFNAYAIAGLVGGVRRLRASDIANPLDELNINE